MDIVQPMTAIAVALQDDLGDVLGRMAGVTVDAAVRARQRVL